MILHYFESFDTMARTDVGLDAGGDQDTAPYWSNPTYARHAFVNGPTGHGQAIQVREHMRWLLDSRIPDPTLLTVGANVRLAAQVGGNEDNYIFAIGRGETYDPASMLELRVGSTGAAVLQYNGVAIGSVHSALFSTTVWHHVMLDINQTTNVVKFYYDGALLETVSAPSLDFTDFESAVNIGKIPTGLNTVRHDICVDDVFIVSGGMPTEDDGPILGVQVGATHDRYEVSSLTGFLGTMILDGDRYESTSFFANIATESYDPGKNLGSKLNYLWQTNPSTSENWSEYDITLLSHWGVCCDPDGSNHTARLSNMILEVLYYNDGQPKVVCAKPGPAAYFSGPWVKQDPTLPYYAHVNKIPRDTEEEWADTTSLFIDDYGCMLFATRFPPDDEPEPLGKIGITFAEERRTDYTDWVDVLGQSGVDYVSYFTSGYSLAGQSDKFFANNYTTINYKNVAGGGGYARGVWDFSNNADGSRWSMRQLIYAPTRVTGGYYTHGSRKLLIRGNGRALQVRIDSESGKPFQINGWAMYITGNSKA